MPVANALPKSVTGTPVPTLALAEMKPVLLMLPMNVLAMSLMPAAFASAKLSIDEPAFATACAMIVPSFLMLPGVSTYMPVAVANDSAWELANAPAAITPLLLFVMFPVIPEKVSTWMPA